MNNLLSVSGKTGSGKDTVYDLINFFEYGDNLNKPFLLEHFVAWKGMRNPLKNKYRNIKFADKVKDIMCLLLGCTREDLENHDFKDTELGEEWTKWLFDGTYNEYSAENRYPEEQYVDIYFNTEKEAVSYAVEFKANHTEAYTEVIEVKMTPRKLMQLLGTECGRNIIHPNVWVNAVFARYTNRAVGVKPYEEEPISEKAYVYEPPNWIITDVRFQNELEAIRDRNGVVIRLNCWFEKRLMYQEAILYTVEKNRSVYMIHDDGSESLVTEEDLKVDMSEQVTYVLERPEKEHESETALDNAEFDYTIKTEGTVTELASEIRLILTTLKLKTNG